MRSSANVYKNRKGEYGVVIRIPMEVASGLAVGRDESIGVLRAVIADALNDQRGSGMEGADESD